MKRLVMCCLCALVCLWCLFPSEVWAQNAKIDSLEAFVNQRLQQKNEDSVSLDLLNTLAWELRRSKTQKALDYAFIAERIGLQLKLKNQLRRTYQAIAVASQYQAQYEKAIEYAQKNRLLCQELKKPISEGSVVLTLGNIYLFTNRYDSAAIYYSQVISICSPFADTNE